MNVEEQIYPDEENSLDSFFKKKDKKGKKKKKKKDIVEETSEVVKPKKKEPEQRKEENPREGEDEEEHEEWIDFEDESQRDYSDLKIQNLQITEGEENNIPVDVPEYNEAGELMPPKADEGPWRKVNDPNPPTQTSAEEVKEAPAPQEAPKKTGAYRPPQARNSASSGGNPMLMRRGKRQQAPEINNELDFPSLEAAAKDTVEHKGFEIVKTGNKSSASWKSNQQQNKTSDIRLNNQFSALQ